ncbi:MAG: hypothetical protein ABEK59_06555 [Halobacteria archaeon]
MASISIKRLVGSVGGALTILSVFAVALMASGSMFGTIGPGIGGFQAEFGEVNGSDFTMYSTPSTTEVCGDSKERVPVLSATVNNATVKGMMIKKSVDLPDSVPLENVSFAIEQNKTNTKIDTLSMELTSLRTDKIDISSNITLGDKLSKEDDSRKLGDFGLHGAGKLMMEGGITNAQVVSFNGASLKSGVGIDMQVNEKDRSQEIKIANSSDRNASSPNQSTELEKSGGNNLTRYCS